ncbi:hypothetical protein DRE_01125 [Drechslerella stenobrocha 248]|uniref:Nucleotide-diphospho-sugar transferase domain-containing protein n=1 Tax=Drechslerella stenobrocha 248 TaxID=1043628 RepID=W7HMF8_9PEZI|nr:hypothetical protein DRE_01125 [Drechslerella stenobrocha 248]
MDSKEFLFPNNKSPTMRRMRAPFLGFCLLTLCISTYLLWSYGATLPHAFNGFEDVNSDFQGGLDSAPDTQPAVVSTIVGPTSDVPNPPTASPVLGNGAALDASGSTNLPYFDLVWWLRGIGRVPGDPLVFMIVTNADMAPTFNMHATLEKHGREDNFFVLCLEKACLQAPEVFTFDVSGMNRISVKIAASIQLLKQGFNFVFVDPDVYFTDAIDPFAEMYPLSNPSWDIQFFPGPGKAQQGLDSSFFWARPNQQTKMFFNKVKENWSESGDQNINSLMNVVAFEMANGAATLNLHILPTLAFKSWGDFLTWEPKYFDDKVAISAMQNKTAAIHTTCVDPSMRTYLARNFGAWCNVESYYSGKKRFIGVKGLEGDVSHASKIIGFAAKVAMDTHRTLIFPSSATITQARKNETTGAADYVTVKNFPAYRIVDPSSLDSLTLRVVEAMYLNNRARYTTESLSEETLIMGNGHSAKDPMDGKPVVVKTINDKTDVDIIWMDMGNGRWWDLDASGNMATYTKEVQAAIKVCGNANEEKFVCGKRCL